MKRAIRIEGDVAYIKLTKGCEAVIDVADVPLVEGRNWYASSSKHTVYARRDEKLGDGRARISLHRIVIGAEPGVLVDHIDGNGLNNRRSNLRLATNAENMRNARGHLDSASGAKGVSWHKGAAKWRAAIMADRQEHYLGLFDTVESAHAAYCDAAKRLHGQFARVA